MSLEYTKDNILTKREGYFLLIEINNIVNIYDRSGKAIITVKTIKISRIWDKTFYRGHNASIEIKKVNTEDKMTLKLDELSLKEKKEKNYTKEVLSFLKKENISVIGTEYITDVWRIDILCSKNDIFTIIELKKNKLLLKDIYQLKCYMDHFDFVGHKNRGLLIWREIDKNLIKIAEQEGVLLADYDSYKEELNYF